MNRSGFRFNRKRRFFIPSISIRNNHGSNLAELPVVLMVVFLCLLFPMINLVSLGVRSGLAFAAVQDAVRLASRSRSFQVDTDNGPSAKTSAIETLTRFQNGFSGIKLAGQSTTVSIIQTPIANPAETLKTQSPLESIDTKTNLYQIEVAIDAQTSPLVLMKKGLLGDIPGVTSPLKYKLAARSVVEYAPGLTR